MKVNEIIKKIEKFAPLETQEDWDNSGWQINLKKEETKNILITTTVTKNVLENAIKENIDLIISHHPIIFSPIKKIEDEIIIKAIKNNIQIYSMHTNFDKAEFGTTQSLATFLGFNNLEKINDYVYKTEITEKITTKEILEKIKSKMGIEKIKVVNYNQKEIKNISFCAGSGGSFIKEIKNTDIYITSDIKYHDTQNEESLIIVDLGHLETEKISLNKIKEIIEEEGINVKIAEEKTNFKYI